MNKLNRASVAVEADLNTKLKAELERLKRTLSLGYELKVEWMPNVDSNLSGEVKHDIIYVYEERQDEAIKTLRHEFLDYAISRLLEPYKQVTNSLISLINQSVYTKKENLVDSLMKLL